MGGVILVMIVDGICGSGPRDVYPARGHATRHVPCAFRSQTSFLLVPDPVEFECCDVREGARFTRPD